VPFPPWVPREIDLKNWNRHQNADLNLRFRSRKNRSGNRESGQIVVEYVLLLVVAVSLATLITRTMISQSQGQTGFVITFWQQIIDQIGSDKADDIESSGAAK
jgi:Flp pilus assembly pilin Flp